MADQTKKKFSKKLPASLTVSKDVMVTGEQCERQIANEALWLESLSIWPGMFVEFPTGIFA